MISGILFVILCVFLLLTWQIIVWKKSAHPLPPALSGYHPIIGHTLSVVGDTTKTWQTLNRMSKETVEKGGVIHAYIGPQLYYLITDPEDALTAANMCMQKHFIYNYIKNWLGEGLFTSSGDLWQRHRKLLNPAFAAPVVHSFLDIFNTMSKVFAEEVAPFVGRGPFSHANYLRVTAFRTFSRTAFGISDDSVKEFARNYMERSDQVMDLVVHRFLNVWLHNDFLFRLSGLKKKESKLIKELDDMANLVIERKKEETKNFEYKRVNTEYSSVGTRSKPLMSLLMELKNDDSLTEKEIKEEVDTAIVAGFDTTSNTMTILMVCLGSYPEVQQKVYEEIMEVVGPNRDVDKEDIKKLVYIEAVIKEVLRVYPIGPALLRHVDKDVKLKNYTMRAGSDCVILPLGTHSDIKFGEDFAVFRPERWLEPAVASLGNNSFYGFSLGKRSCIGKLYAMVSMKVTLAHFIRRYKLTADINKMEFKVEMLLKPKVATISIERRN